MKPFQLNSDPLEGVTLIEAGAGTGKTYTLTGIFLRLIVEQGLLVDQILVVTYTKAATEELKTRIRAGLLQLKAVFANGSSSDRFESMLVANTSDTALAVRRIQNALTNFDRAAIFTIHGFCQRVLQQFAFETGSYFQSDLVQSAQPHVQELADDFWRRHISRAPYELARFAVDRLKGPERLASLFALCGFPDVVIRHGSEKVALRSIRPWRQHAENALSLWQSARDDICRQLEAPSLYVRPYGKCEPHPHRDGQTHRQVFIERLSAAMDRWNGRYPLFKQFVHFGSTYIQSHTKKGQKPPDHPYFNVCDLAIHHQEQMELQLAQYMRYLKVRFLKRVGDQMRVRKITQNVLFFDDLLINVHRALHGKQAERLINAVRGIYRIALVDEFQDTDPLQYDIFHRLFAHGKSLLALIGDPKQAIYSFRGADLFSYLKAAGEASVKTTLTRNWRSTPSLIRAVNTIFSRHARPFGFDQIEFREAIPADGADDDSSSAPLTIWYLTPGDSDVHTRPVRQEEAVRKIAAAVSAEIGSLLDPGAGTGFAPEQIAVLTRTHAQSQTIKTALAEKGVPAVLHGAGSVFHTRDALCISRFMAAVAAPTDRVLANAVLAGDYYRLKADDFSFGDHGASPAWQTCWSALARYHQVWTQRGFYAMFRFWMNREGIKARLLGLPDGERRLTNLIHLGELLHQAETAHRFGADALIQWIAGRMQARTATEDEQQLRLESDSRAVRIITMHKSKGLQFDVVFCPFVWGGVRTDPGAVVFHDAQNDHALTLSIEPGLDPAHQLQARREGLSENLRMLYVALTRARKRCYMAWGRINKADISAPAYLIHGPRSNGHGNEQIARLQERMNNLTDAGCIADLQQLSDASGGTIRVEKLPYGPSEPLVQEDRSQEPLQCRIFKGSVEPKWRIASFSSMTAKAHDHAAEWPDRDQSTTFDDPPVEPPAEFQRLIDFPRGAHAGLFFHDLLEHWQHTEADRRDLRMLVRSKLTAHAIDPRWEPVLCTFLVDLAQTDLVTTHGCFSLSQVAAGDRIDEMSFYYPIQAFHGDALARVFKAAGQQNPLARKMEWQIERLVFTPAKGLMKGYVDTILRYGGRYYILDWKSNYLGPDPEDYNDLALERTMVESYYFLQYLLYSVAVDRMLRLKVPGYSYERHFGGVLYLFLRGISASENRPRGVYSVLPDKGLIEGLGNLLIGPSS